MKVIDTKHTQTLALILFREFFYTPSPMQVSGNPNGSVIFTAFIISSVNNTIMKVSSIIFMGVLLFYFVNNVTR